MTTKHTPGPWYLSPKICGDRVIFAETMEPGEPLLAGGQFTVAETKPTRLPETRAANARLIAAAPDLLAACQTLIAIEGKGIGGRCTHCIESSKAHARNCPVGLARAAIAKAEGV